jgi:hypothetical protein
VRVEHKDRNPLFDWFQTGDLIKAVVAEPARWNEATGPLRLCAVPVTNGFLEVYCALIEGQRGLMRPSLEFVVPQ